MYDDMRCIQNKFVNITKPLMNGRFCIGFKSNIGNAKTKTDFNYCIFNNPILRFLRNFRDKKKENKLFFNTLLNYFTGQQKQWSAL